jgi:EpsD family peptidyl-prolyl cis-trans isomerase
MRARSPVPIRRFGLTTKAAFLIYAMPMPEQLIAADKSPRHALMTVLMGCALLLSGCGGHQNANADFAARVDSVVITRADVAHAIALLPSAGEEPSSATRRKVLDNLINQQLAVARAEDTRLDRQPDVMASLEAGRREVLARAYFEKAAADQPRPTATEVHDYYVAHPELFAQRRIYTLNELNVSDHPALAERLNSLALAGAAYPQMVQWLRDENVPFSTQATARPAEALPLQYLPRLAQLQAGRMLVMSDDSGIHAAQVVSTDLAPIDEASAAASIRRFLANQDTKQAVEAEIVRLRAKAKIEYGADTLAPDQGSAASPDAGKGVPMQSTSVFSAPAGGALAERSRSKLSGKALASQ